MLFVLLCTKKWVVYKYICCKIDKKLCNQRCGQTRPLKSTWPILYSSLPLFKNKFTFLIYQQVTVTGGTKHAGHELNFPICNDLYMKRKAEWFSQELECTCSSHFKVTLSSLKRKSFKSRSNAHFHIALGFAVQIPHSAVLMVQIRTHLNNANLICHPKLFCVHIFFCAYLKFKLPI